MQYFIDGINSKFKMANNVISCSACFELFATITYECTDLYNQLPVTHIIRFF